MEKALKKVLVIGAGFAGLEVALLLQKHCEFEVTIVSKSCRFVFTPGIYDFVKGGVPSSKVCKDLVKFLKDKCAKIEEDEITSIDWKKKVAVGRNCRHSFDYLVISVGAVPNYYGIKGAEKYAVPLKTARDAMKLHDLVCDAKKIILCGGGYSGVELASKLKEEHPEKDVTVVHRNAHLVPNFSMNAIEKLHKKMRELDIKLELEHEIKEVGKGWVKAEGEKIEGDLIVWTGGVKPCPMIKKFGLPMLERGDILVDDYLQVKDGVFAAGDCCSKGLKTAQDAVRQGKVVAKNILRLHKKKPLVKYRQRMLPFIVSIGDSNALFVYKNIAFCNLVWAWIKKVFVENMYLWTRFKGQ